MSDTKKKNALYRFFQNKRNVFKSLQEMDFERNEKRLKLLLETEDGELNYPIPVFVPVLLIWLFAILFPLVMIVDPSYMLDNGVNMHGLIGFYVPLIMTALIFQLNQRIFVPRCIFKKHYVAYFVYNALVVGIALFIREVSLFIVDRSPDDGIAFFFSNYCFSYAKGHFSAWTLISFILLVCFVCVICVVYHIMLRQIIKAFIQREQKRSRVQYELDFLKNQLSPHFLFNTLNNISALIAIEPRRAEKAMTQLSSLLRITLYQTSDKYIPVKEDIEILKKYAELEKLRLDENFDFRFDVDLENPDCQIAPLISMPLMENSIKHSIGPHGKNFAHISIRQQGDQITFEAVNSNNPRKSKSASGGLGLATFIKRLELTYMDKYEYTVESDEKTYRCKLRIWGLSSL